MTPAPRGGPILRASPWARVAAAILLAALALAGALALTFDIAAVRSSQGLASRLGAAQTVVVWSHGLESADAAQARAAEILAATPGASRVAILDPDPGDALLARALGAPDGAEARLITLGGGATRPLLQALAAQGVPAALVDASWRTGEGSRSVEIAVAVGVLAPILALAAFALVCAVEGRRELVRGRPAVELMRGAGAHDSFIVGLVRRRVAGLALTAGLWGAVGAVIAATILAREGYAAVLGGLARADVLWPWAPMVVAAWAVGALAAGAAAGRSLRARGVKGLAALVVVAMIWVAGLLAFADRVARETPPDEPAPADGIVALTGGSDLRLAAATDLLEAGKGKRLLVSGVNRAATRGDLWNVTGAAKPLFDCCVDLGFTAADTLGNARETADWARAMDYKHLILVTADYHMPRALIELRAAMPGVTVTPYPVATATLDARRWSDTSLGARRLVQEYCKYLAILAREAVLGPPDARSAKVGTGFAIRARANV